MRTHHQTILSVSLPIDPKPLTINWEVLLGVGLGLRRDSISFAAMLSCGAASAWPAALQGLRGMRQAVPAMLWMVAKSSS